jgi:hypothetical protein
MARMSKILALTLAAALPLAAVAAVEVKGGGSSNVAKVNSDGSLQVNEGASSRVTYIASSSALVTTALYSLSLEAEASRGFKVLQICASISNFTAATAGTVIVRRTTTASSGGQAATSEGTGADAVSRMDPNDSTWTGVVRRTGTLGTLGPTLDQWGFQSGVISSGNMPQQPCKVYGLNGEKPPRVLSGVANGLHVTVTGAAGGLAMGSISVTFIAE